MAKSTFNIYENVTNRCIEQIERAIAEGTKPFWKKPWRTDGSDLPRNLNSKRPYRGINVFLLALQGYSSPYWVTYKGALKAGLEWTEDAKEERLAQIEAEWWKKNTDASVEDMPQFTLPDTQGHVKPGEKGTVVIFWNRYSRAVRDGETPDGEVDGKPVKYGATLRYYRVWNVEQCEGLKLPKEDHTDPREWNPIDEAEAIIEGYPEGMPDVNLGRNLAAYSPSLDEVYLPNPEDFEPRESFYATRFHEDVHATGHESRLGRFSGDVEETVFGSESYSKEELVAELGTSFLCAFAGIDTPDITENSENYLLNWVNKLKGDSKLIVQAAGQAQAAVDYMLGASFEESEGTE